MCRVQANRSHYRHDLADEVGLDPLNLCVVPDPPSEEMNILACQLWQQFFIPESVLLLDEIVGGRCDLAVDGGGRGAVSTADFNTEVNLGFQAGDAYLEEFVKVARYDTKKAQAFQ